MVLDSVRESLFNLATAHYVERCPAPEPLLMAATEEETPARKRGSKSSKVFAYSCQIHKFRCSCFGARQTVNHYVYLRMLVYSC